MSDPPEIRVRGPEEIRQAIRESILQDFPPEKLAEIVARLPAKFQEMYHAQFAERPVTRRFRIIRKKRKKP